MQAVATTIIVPTPELVSPSGPFLVNLESASSSVKPHRRLDLQGRGVYDDSERYQSHVIGTAGSGLRDQRITGPADLPDRVIDMLKATLVVKFEVLSKDGIKQAGEFYTFTFRILGANTGDGLMAPMSR